MMMIRWRKHLPSCSVACDVSQQSSASFESPAVVPAYAGSTPACAGSIRRGLAEHSWLGIWLALFAIPLALRAPAPPDELRYLAVAWEMWSRGDFLVPYLNGVPYDHKGPLLFWLMHAGWMVFGVNDWWPRTLPSLLALSAIFLTRRLMSELWPERRAARTALPWLLLGSVGWTTYMQVILVDMLLVNSALIAWLGFAQARRGARSGWLLVAAGILLGLLTKGPVILLHVAGAGLCAPWWSPDRPFPAKRWYASFFASAFAAIAVALGWAAVAIAHAGTAYGAGILLHQTAGRVVNSFAHARPWWFYAFALPALLLPWAVWPAAWTAVRHGFRSSLHDWRLRFVVSIVIPALFAFSLISGKQPHYVLPLVPLFVAMLAVGGASLRGSAYSTLVPFLLGALGSLALAFAPRLTDALSVSWSPAWGMAAALALLALARRGAWLADVKRLALFAPITMLAFEAAFFTANRAIYDPSAAAAFIHEALERGYPVVYVGGDYSGEFHFPARLTEPLDMIEPHDDAVAAWQRAHPDGYVVRVAQAQSDSAAYQQRLRGAWLIIENSATALHTND